MAVDNAEQEFTSVYDGYIGLAPPRSIIEKQRSFLFNARNDGIIDNLVFSLYTDVSQNDIKSSIKFGGYDKSGIASDDGLTYLQTVNATSWGLAGQFLILDGRTIMSDGSVKKTVLIEPQLPYLYLPQYDIGSFVREAALTFDGISCHSTYCRYDYSCDKVKIGDKKLYIQVFSSAANRMQYNLEFDSKRLLIPGTEVGDSENTCYLAVFGQNAKQDAWYFGNVILSDYYLVFDMENYVQHEFPSSI